MADNKPKTVLERLEGHDKVVASLQQNMDNAFSTLRSSLQSAMELIEAVVHTVEGGPAKVEEVLKAKRLERATQKADQEKKQVETLVSQGILKVTQAVTEMSLIIGRIFDKDGSVNGAGRNQVEFASLNPDIKSKFLGQGPGFVFTTETGEKFEILEVYEIVPPAAPANPEPAPVATETAPTPAATPSETGSWAS